MTATIEATTPPFPKHDDFDSLLAENRRLAETNALLNANLTATQGRCTEILEDARHWRRIAVNMSASAQLLAVAGGRQNHVRVLEFMQATGQKTRRLPGVPDDEDARLRAMLIAEECFEVLAEIIDTDWADLRDETLARATMMPVFVDLPKLAKELSDLRYVLDGTDLTFGITTDEIDRAVHAANMRKVGAPRDANGKIQKGEGYEPPDVEGALREMGWEE